MVKELFQVQHKLILIDSEAKYISSNKIIIIIGGNLFIILFSINIFKDFLKVVQWLLYHSLMKSVLE